VTVEFFNPPALPNRPLDENVPLESLSLNMELQASTSDASSDENSQLAETLTETLNLDTTCMIALVSDISNQFHTLDASAFDIPAFQIQKELEANVSRKANVNCTLHDFHASVFRTRC
jgi:hypothetical protein